MARPHCVFIQAQDLPFKRGLYGGGRPGVQVKVLSIDEAKGDSTVIIRYPKGYVRKGPEHLLAHEEFLVLEGSLTINGLTYGQHSYAFLPAGHMRKSYASKTGAVLLTTFSTMPRVESGAPARGVYDKKLLIEQINTFDMPWDDSLVDPQLAKGVAIKPLRTDPYTGETSFLYSTAPHRIPKGGLKPKWSHSMIEEIFCIDGEYVWGDCGVMGPGGYVWWREHVYHGPSGSIAGYNLWVRTVNGPMHNIFDDKKLKMNWNPPYRPRLPAALKKHAKGYVRPPNY